MFTELIGWSAAIILLATIARQVYSLERDCFASLAMTQKPWAQ